MKPLVVPAVEGAGYARTESRISYSPLLAHYPDGQLVLSLRRDWARAIAWLNGYRLSTAAEEQLLAERGHTDAAFDDYSRHPDGGYNFRNWTDTDLAKPKGRKKDYTKTENGRRYWLRIVLEGGEQVGELWVPEAGLVREWSPFGVPSRTVPEREHGSGSETHFDLFFPRLDCVILYRHEAFDQKCCFDLRANGNLTETSEITGFRLVDGPRSRYARR